MVEEVKNGVGEDGERFLNGQGTESEKYGMRELYMAENNNRS